MSIWTHVSGCVRIDGLSILGDDMEAKISSAFGNTCDFDDPRETWEACTVPCGSEGSVQYKIAHTGDENDMAWGLVYIWGDLRDYSDVDEICQWIKKACADLWVRGCAVSIKVEGGRSAVIVLNEYGDLTLVDLEGK